MVSVPPTSGCAHLHSQCDTWGASKTTHWSESSRALPRGHTSPQTTVLRRLHTAHVTSTQHPTTRAVSARAYRAPAAFRSQLRHAHIPYAQSIGRDRTDARCGELTVPHLGWAASSAATEAWAVAAVTHTTAELLREPRASEHEAGSHTGVFEGPPSRRVLCTSPTSRAAGLSKAIVALVDALT